MVAVRNFSMIVSIIEVSPRKFAGLRTVHWPSRERKRQMQFPAADFHAGQLVEIDRHQAFVAQVIQAFVQIRFRILGNGIHFGFAGNHDVSCVARWRFIADQDRLRLSIFFRRGNCCVGIRQAKLFQIRGMIVDQRRAVHRRQIVKNR